MTSALAFRGQLSLGIRRLGSSMPRVTASYRAHFQSKAERELLEPASGKSEEGGDGEFAYASRNWKRRSVLGRRRCRQVGRGLARLLDELLCKFFGAVLALRGNEGDHLCQTVAGNEDVAEALRGRGIYDVTHRERSVGSGRDVERFK